MQSFRKLLEEADEYCGITSSHLIPLEDTSQFEAAYKEQTDDGKPKVVRNQVAVPDMDKLRTLIQKIAFPEEESGDVVLGSYTKQLAIPRLPNIEKITNSASVQQPYYEWEKDVREAMELDNNESTSLEAESDEDHRGNHSSRVQKQNIIAKPLTEEKYRTHKFSRIHRLEGDIAPYHCFDTDFIDVDRKYDPLEKVFLNESTEDDIVMEIDPVVVSKAPDAPQQQQKKPTRSLRDRLFLRFNKSDADPTADDDGVSQFFSPDDAMRKEKQLKEKQRLQEKIQRIKAVNTWMDASTALVKTSSKRTRDITLNSRLKLIASFNHSPIAISHRNTHPDLKQIELKYFHRPRMLKERDRPWLISLKVKSSSRKVKQTGDVGKVVVTEEDKGNLSLVHSDQKFVLVEYIEEFPPVMLNYGMASSVVNYFRSSSTATANELDAPNSRNVASQGAAESSAPDDGEDFHKRKLFRKSAETLSAKEIEQMKKQIAESGCVLPRHLLLLWELNHKKRSYEHDANIPKQPIGSTKVLNPEDPSPFLGNIEEGELQIAFENNLFRSPLFYHPPPSSDFLLIRTKLLSNALHYSIREFPQKFPSLFLSGQIEPQAIVPRPTAKLSATQENFYKLTILRYLLSRPAGVTLAEVTEHVLKYCAKEVTAPHKQSHRNAIRDFLREMADEMRDNSSMTSKFFLKDFPPNSEAETKYSIDHLSRQFTPEEVCIQEACNNAEYRLLQSNITDVDLMKVQTYLNFLHLKKQHYKLRYEGLTAFVADTTRRWQLLSSSSSSSQALGLLGFGSLEQFQARSQKLLDLLSREIFRLQKKQQIARFLLERLMVAPWNTTEAFVNSVIRNDNQGKMDVRGKGDPSGRGEGFAFVRLPKISAIPLGGTGKKKDDKESNKLVGTDKDLRKLTKVDAINLLVALDVKKDEATRLGRWDRIHMIRTMVDKLVAQGCINQNNLSKYVRDPNLLNKLKSNQSGDQQNVSTDEFKTIANEIWKRQKLALSSESSHPLKGDSQYTKELKKREKKLQKKRQHSDQLSPRANRERAASSGGDRSPMLSSGEEEEEEGEDDDEDSDDSDASFIEKTLASRKAVANPQDLRKTEEMRREEEDKLEFQQFNSMLGKSSSNPALAHVPAQQQQQQQQKMKLLLIGGNQPSSVVTPTSSVAHQLQQQQPAQLWVEQGAGQGLSQPLVERPAIRYPAKVVRRLTRSTTLEGKEVLRVEFIFSEQEVQRIETVAERARLERKEKRTTTALSHHPFARSAGRHGDRHGTDSDDELLASNPTMSLNVSKLRQRVDEHNQIQAFVPSKKDRTLTIKTSKLSKQQAANFQHDKELEILANQSKSSKRSLLSQQYINPRLPRVSLAVRLEKEVMQVWTRKEAEVFRFPVDRSQLPQYYAVISQPISLQDIREKTVSYRYETVEDFLADFRLMYENSERFNGKLHGITLNAKKIYETLRVNIDHEREMYKDQNYFHKLEGMIAQKKSFFRRGHAPGSLAMGLPSSQVAAPSSSLLHFP